MAGNSDDEILAEGVRKIKASLDLQKKVGTGTIDDLKIDRAQNLMNNNKVDFAPIAKPHLDQLHQAIALAGKAKDKTDPQVMNALMVPIMNIKANAGTFNYPLISGLTSTVLMFLEEAGQANKKVLQVVDLLHKTVILLMHRGMSGSGGAEGAMLQSAFEEVCAKMMKKIKAAG